MYQNLTSLRIEVTKNYINLHPTNKQMIKENQQENFNMFGNDTSLYREVYPRWQVISIKEAKFALQCLTGNAPFYPFFDDLNHHIKFTTEGIHEVDKNGDKWQDYYFTISGNELAKWIEYCIEISQYLTGENDRLTFDILPEKLYQLKCQYAPRCQWDFREGVKDKLVKDLNNSNQTRLDTCLKSLVRIAKNYSNGKPSKIYLAFDSYNNSDDNIPSSYYFVIYNSNDKVIMNGGIIAHKRDDNQVEYSTHT